ncbi:ATP-dependent Clp protease ATP-binding subunit ClpX (plasmid) [Helicobacter bizzozeronii CIII-1]|uniref:ATP-dependent Clp protease ATP-binding subunit ClpX n=1 Tax=Helicobacter bizzozeronii (strain CIII-1) TaxID=1002804 RepID=F8KUH7_HELBC|nr:AAA family ATPase [Helicobacter bizzozeronii]CCB80912.1 ATP-dependent Clp protease ATP-binding subunit ClpX [Helicobacter bizzozeronii CIII-1]
MQEVGYYDLKEFLILKGVRYDLEKRISKRIFNDCGLLPKSYAFDFEQERQAYVKTLLKKQGRIAGVDAYAFPKEGEQKAVIKIDFGQIAQDCGGYWFFPRICKERQNTEPKQLFSNSAQIEKFICGCFSFSKQICDYAIKQYLKRGYGGLFGDLKIPFKAFKQDLLGVFKDHNFKLPKTLCQLEPYCVDGDLVFAITPSHAKKTGLSKQSIDCFYKLATQEENKADLSCLINILCGKRLGFTPSHKEKRLMRLRLERDCGLLEPACTPKDRWSLEKALKDANIPFARVLTSQKERCYYFPIGFKLWACARLKDVFKKKEFASTLEALYEQLLHKGQGTLLTDLKESSKPDAFWSCVQALLSHVQLPMRSVVQKEGWHMDKSSDFFSLALLLNQKPTPEGEIRQLLMLQDSSETKESHATQQATSTTNSKNNQNAQRIAQLRKEIQKLQEEVDAKEILSDEDYLDWGAKNNEICIKANEIKFLERGLDPFVCLYDDFPEPKHIYAPKEIAQHLSGVSGQEKAKKALCVILSDHYARFHDQPCMPKTNMLLIGPSGSGKTFMTTTLLKKLGIAYHIVDASSLTPAGWRGEDVLNIFVGLYQSAGKDIEKAQKGVIFLDEVDKLGVDADDERFKTQVQNEFLKLMEGHDLTFKYDDKSITLKTNDILFIFAGYFKDLYTSLNTATKPQCSIGFMNTAPTASSQPPQEVSSQDLERCGLSKEFIGRIGLRVVLEPVNPQMLADAIIQELKPFQDCFLEHGSVLEINKEAQEMLIAQAIEEGTGMRAIKTLLSQVIHPLRFGIEAWRGYKCLITAEVLSHKKEPTKIALNVPKNG